MKPRNFLVLVIVAGLAASLLDRGGQAQLTLPGGKDDTLSRLGQRVGGFLEEIANDNVDEAVEQFLVRSPLLKDAARVARLKESIQRVSQQYGAFLKVEPVQLERAGRSLVRAVYLYECDDYPIVWSITFYRPDDEGDWSVISLQFHLDYDRVPTTP